MGRPIARARVGLAVVLCGHRRRRTGLGPLRLHDLRHTFGSYLAMLGKSLPEIMEALGHKTAEAAMRYVHLADGHKTRVSAEVNEQISAWSHDITSRAQS